jgi:hypothetical protein
MLLFAKEAQAVEYSISGFGTLGGAVSDNDIKYQRYIDDHGTLKRDSLLGVQFDAKLNDKFGVTTQLILAPSTDDDDVITPQLKWTMISYRPTNDWLIRLGRISLGGLLNQQNLDVGVSYDMLRLPNEVYLLSSSYDFDGVSIAKTWDTTNYEVTLDGSFGMQNRYFRSYYNYSKEPTFNSADVTAGGLILTVTDYDQTMYRAGWHYTKIDPDGQGVLSEYTFVELGGGLYTLGQPIYKSDTYGNTFFLGTRFPLGGFLISCEGTAIIVEDFDAAPPTVAGYISVSRKMDNWTPYLTYAQVWTEGLETWRKVQGATAVPSLGVTQGLIDDGASIMAVYDQNSWMLGTSYAFSPKQKLKAEVMLTHVGDRSAMFDGSIANENVMVYSLSYNFAF